MPATAALRPVAGSDPEGRRGPSQARPIALGGALVLLLLAAVLSVLFGVRDIALADIGDALLGRATSADAVVIASQRIPRTLLGVVAGVALGVAGALMQGHTRNPLADPGLFGVNAGASFGVVLLAFALDVRAPSLTVLAALAGAGAATIAVFAIGSLGRLGGTPVTLALGGAAIGALLAAATNAVMLLDQQSLDVMRVWSVGSIAARDDATLPLGAAIVALGLALAIWNSPGLNALGLGDDLARSLGSSPRRIRWTGMAAITLLAGGATAMCGPLGFIGLVVPHLARIVARADHRWLVPLSGLLGGGMLLLADVAGRLVLPVGELPAGIMTSAVGAPVLIALVLRKRVRSL